MGSERTDSFYRLLFDHSMDGVLFTAPDGRILAANRAICEMLGRTEEEICKAGRAGVIDATDPRLPASLEERTRTGRTRAELTLLRADGTHFPGELTSAVFEDEQGQSRTVMIIRDVTAGHRLAKEREQYFRFFMLSTDAMCIGDPFGRMTRVNPAFERMTGLPESVLVSRPFLDFVVPEDRQDTADALKEQVAVRPLLRFQNRYRRADGSVIVLSWTAYYDDTDGVIYATARDVTELRRLDAQNRRQAQLFAALSHCNEAIVRSGNERELFERICRAAVQFGGLKMAWIGLTDAGSLTVRPVASFGDAAGYLGEISISYAPDSVFARGPTGTAIREDRAYWCQDFQNDPATAPWHESGARSGLASSASLPLHRGGAVVGAFTLYAGVTNAFDERTRNMLVEMASNISFALDNFTRESLRRSAEDALARESNRNMVFLRNASDGIHILDADGNVIEVSDSFCQMLGYSREELLGAHVSLWDAQWSAQQLRGNISAHIASADRLIIETRQRRRDGTVIEVELTAQPLELDGKPVLFASSRDITARKEGQAALRLQSAALNAAANAIVITDAGGTIEWANAAFTVLSGYEEAEAVGRNMRDLVKSGTQEAGFYAQMWETILAGNVWQGELTNRRKDGSTYREEQTITPVKDDGGGIAHFIAIKRDLTEHDQMEAKFLQAQKMETVGRLAGGIAHDFNNLLTVINGTAELASMNLKADDPLKRELGEIRRYGDRAAALTRQLLAFSRKQIMTVDLLNLNTMVANVRGMLQRMIGEDIALAVTTEPALGSVVADRMQIEQVVMNLAVNARDAMPDGGTLTIETANVDVTEGYAADHPSVSAGPHVMLSISDTGVGMDATTLEHVFEPFFTTKELGKGTGLGLSTVYGIVKQSGGGVWVDSVLGKGTSVRIYLPLVEGTARRLTPVTAIATTKGTETILIVEDDEAVRQLATRVLRTAGYAVLAAANGVDALLVLRQHTGAVDLVVTDMVMPGMSGRELVAEFDVLSPHTKVLLTSGYSSDPTQRRGLPDTKTHFLAKPYTTTDLTRTVREVLDAQDARPAEDG